MPELRNMVELDETEIIFLEGLALMVALGKNEEQERAERILIKSDMLATAKGRKWLLDIISKLAVARGGKTLDQLLAEHKASL